MGGRRNDFRNRRETNTCWNFRFRDGEGKAFGGGYHDSSVKTNAVGQQGQYGNGDGYHTGGGGSGEVANSHVYGSRSDSGGGVGIGPNVIVAGTPFLVTTVESLPPLVQLTPQYVQQQSPQYLLPTAPPPPPPLQYAPQTVPFVPQALPYVPQAPVQFQNGVPQLPPYSAQLPALSLTARSPSGQYVVPMPPKLYVDKPNATSDG